MDIAGFFASIAHTYKEKYLNLAQQFGAPQMPDPVELPTSQPEAVESEPTAAKDAPVDVYVPSNETVDTRPITTVTPTDTDDTTEVDDPETPATEVPVEQKPDGTYYYQRQARLEYDLNMQFDLAAISRTIESLAEGDVSAVEELSAGGFGLHVDFDLKGMQRVRTNMEDQDGLVHQHQLTEAKSRRAGKFAAQSRDFAVKSFFKEASRIHRSLNTNARGAHRQAVNRFAARFRLDNQFSFAHLQRFNVQTEQVAADSPDNLGGYLGSAGSVAESGSANMMTEFFNAVDAYLGESEQVVLDKVTAFFDAAAEDLGFDDAMTEQARASLTETITGFFDRVEEAVSGLAAHYAPPVETPDPDVIVDPPTEIVPDPATTEYLDSLAV